MNIYTKISNYLLKLQLSFFLFIINAKTSFADVIPMKCIPIETPDASTTPKNSRLIPTDCNWVADSEAITRDFIFKTSHYLLGTILLELPIFYLLGFRSKKAIFTVILMNLITLPLLHFLLFFNFNVDSLSEFWSWTIIILAEIIVVALEGILLKLIVKDVSWKRSLLTSLLANTVSAIVGTIIVSTIMTNLNFRFHPFQYGY